MFPISETLDAGEVLTVEGSGRYFEIVDLTGSVDVRLTTREGREVASGKSVLIGTYFATKDQFETITISNNTASATTVKAFYGDGQAGSKRTSGEVSIKNLWGLDTALAGNAYHFSARGNIGGTIYSRVALRNTGTSPVRVRALEVYCDAADEVSIWMRDTVGITGGMLSYGCYSKSVDNFACPTASVLMGAEALKYAPVYGQGMEYLIDYAAATWVPLSDKNPWIIQPGKCLVAESRYVNKRVAMRGEFET